ncbi:MAG: hypothetical protein O7A08_07795 [SAR324 cluster bacterium]|nr:hypothetical protein [SAR324 cluster bacterium]
MAAGGSTYRRGGRHKGTPNRRSHELFAELEAEGFLDEDNHLVKFLFRVQSGKARGKQVIFTDGGESVTIEMEPSLELRVRAAVALLPYIYPKLVHLDVAGMGGPLEIKIME